MRNKKAFTLIELLIVIAIIGILSTIALVSLNSAKQKAKDKKWIAYVSQVTRAAITAINSDSELDSYYTHQGSCLGDYTGIGSGGTNSCWNANMSRPNITDFNLNNRIFNSSVPKGDFNPNGNFFRGIVIQRLNCNIHTVTCNAYDKIPRDGGNHWILYVNEAWDMSDPANPVPEYCDKFGWNNVNKPTTTNTICYTVLN